MMMRASAAVVQYAFGYARDACRARLMPPRRRCFTLTQREITAALPAQAARGGEAHEQRRY